MKKKIVVMLLAIMCSIAFYAFTTKKSSKKHKNATAYRWWDYLGADGSTMYDNTYYALDPNNVPDCPPVVGSIFCEVYCETDPDSDPEDPKPDLGTLSTYRMKVQ